VWSHLCNFIRIEDEAATRKALRLLKTESVFPTSAISLVDGSDPADMKNWV
jgi:hypothetical protein